MVTYFVFTIYISAFMKEACEIILQSKEMVTMHRIWWETLQIFFFYWIRFSIMVWKSECRLWTKIILGHFQKKKTVENELSLKHYYSKIAWLTRHLLNFPPFLTSRRKGLLRYVSGFRLIFSSQIQKNILFCQTHFSHLLCFLIQCFLYFFLHTS